MCVHIVAGKSRISDAILFLTGIKKFDWTLVASNI